jgi:DNA/RNA endonuclease YhcR with UshA esterase domain
VGQIPAGYTNVIFAAFNPDYTEISWEGGVNYQTVDLVVPEDANMFTLEQLVDDQGAHFKYDGTWSKYEYIEPCVENYGLMEVTGKYTEGTYNEELQQWEILNVELQAGAMFKLYNLCRNETLNVVIAQGAEYFDMGENDELTVKEDGKYNFYLKLDYGNDQLYVTKEETPIVENYDSSADVNNAEKDAQLTLGAFTVVYVNGAYIYIQDENGMTLIYAREYGLKAGDRVAAGLQGVVDIYKGLHEFKPTTAFEDLTIEAGEVPAVKEAAAVPTMADINHMYIYRGVRFNEINGRTITGTFKGETITFYDQFYKFVENTNAPARVAADEQTSYTITGCVSVFNGNLQVYIAEIKEESNTSALEETMMQNNARKMILNGQFYILRDGVIYNAQGAVVR